MKTKQKTKQNLLHSVFTLHVRATKSNIYLCSDKIQRKKNTVSRYAERKAEIRLHAVRRIEKIIKTNEVHSGYK